MAQFVFLYIGGEVPDNLREKNGKDWWGWMESLAKTGRMVNGGNPLGFGGTVLQADGTQKAYNPRKSSGVRGYTIVEAANLEEAVKLTEGCPQLFPEYGSGKLEVRDVLEM